MLPFAMFVNSIVTLSRRARPRFGLVFGSVVFLLIRSILLTDIRSLSRRIVRFVEGDRQNNRSPL